MTLLPIVFIQYLTLKTLSRMSDPSWSFIFVGCHPLLFLAIARDAQHLKHLYFFSTKVSPWLHLDVCTYYWHSPFCEKFGTIFLEWAPWRADYFSLSKALQSTYPFPHIPLGHGLSSSLVVMSLTKISPCLYFWYLNTCIDTHLFWRFLHYFLRFWPCSEQIAAPWAPAFLFTND